MAKSPALDALRSPSRAAAGPGGPCRRLVDPVNPAVEP